MAGTNNNMNVQSWNYITKLVPTIPEAAVSYSGFTCHLIKPSTSCEEKTPIVTGLSVEITNGAILQEYRDSTLNLDNTPVIFQQQKIRVCPARYSQQITYLSCPTMR